MLFHPKASGLDTLAGMGFGFYSCHIGTFPWCNRNDMRARSLQGSKMHHRKDRHTPSPRHVVQGMRLLLKAIDPLGTCIWEDFSFLMDAIARVRLIKSIRHSYSWFQVVERTYLRPHGISSTTVVMANHPDRSFHLAKQQSVPRKDQREARSFQKGREGGEVRMSWKMNWRKIRLLAVSLLRNCVAFQTSMQRKEGKPLWSLGIILVLHQDGLNRNLS